MIYLDHGATSYPKPDSVMRAVNRALKTCGNPGRGGHPLAMAAGETVYACREKAGAFFDCMPEQVVFTSSCTQGLNMAIGTLVKPGDRVVISGFEHNAVVRPLYALGAEMIVAGRKLFSWEDTLTDFEKALKSGVKAAIFTHISNVFGYILPVEQMCALCVKYGVPFAVDTAQSAGICPVSLKKWGADFIAMPGHKGLLGPQGTGILLCNRLPKPLVYGGTGSQSFRREMPPFLPDAGEAGTLNVPGIAGLYAGISQVQKTGLSQIFTREEQAAKQCAAGLEEMGLTVFSGDHQSGTVSFCAPIDCEEISGRLASYGIAVRSGLHCAPLAHESAGTLETGTVRISYGHTAEKKQTERLLCALSHIVEKP